jgi:Helicase HerA, central domain
MRWPLPFAARGGIPIGAYKRGPFTRQLRLSDDEARSHIHVIGKSGSGKSRWVASFYASLINAGYSATLIDPHGDLARLVLRHLVAQGFFDGERAYERLMYLDIPRAAREQRYLRFNCLKQPYDTYDTTRLTLEAMLRAFPALAGGVAPSFEQIVTSGVHVLVEHGLTLPSLRRLLLDKAWRDELLATTKDKLVTSFFRDEFDRWAERERAVLQGSTLRRLFLLLYNPVLRYALSAPDNLLNYRSILQERKSLIVDLSLNDPDSKRLLGCLLTVFAEQGAKSQAALPDEKRATAPHWIVLDEFHLFVSQSAEALTAMLSETRKFNTFVLLSHQTRGQVPERLQSALQNVELEVFFRTGRDDAEAAAKVVGEIDPLMVKHEAEDEAAAARGHPAFFTIQEQREMQASAIQNQAKRTAFVKHGEGQVTQVRSPFFPDPVVNPDRLAKVEEHYLSTCFQLASEEEHAIPRAAPIFEAVNPVRRVKVA